LASNHPLSFVIIYILNEKYLKSTIILQKNIIEDEIVIIFTMSFNYNFYIALIASLYFNYLHYFWYINASHEMV